MEDTCQLCNVGNSFIIYSGIHSRILIPKRMHISPEDGGHLIVIPNRHINSRFFLKPAELLEINYFSIIAGKILTKLCKTEWFNFQENGNWAINKPKELQHLHFHIYGRKKDSIKQSHGESLMFPFKKDLNKWKVESFDEKQKKLLHEYVGIILKESWVREYQLALKAIVQISDE